MFSEIIYADPFPIWGLILIGVGIIVVSYMILSRIDEEIGVLIFINVSISTVFILVIVSMVTHDSKPTIAYEGYLGDPITIEEKTYYALGEDEVLATVKGDTLEFVEKKKVNLECYEYKEYLSCYVTLKTGDKLYGGN